jgi:hypothetical protein
VKGRNMLTALLMLHGIGVGASFVFYMVNDQLSAGVGSAFGWGGSTTPLWKIALGSLVWEGVLVYAFLIEPHTRKS